MNTILVDNIYYTFGINKQSVWVVRGETEYSGSIVIPSQINYEGAVYPVDKIAGRAFYNCTNLSSVTLPESIVSIEEDAFYNTGIYNNASNWEKGVLYVSNCLIMADKSLSGHYTIKTDTRMLAWGAFANCTALTSITIPNGITSIEFYAFHNCSALTCVTIPNTVRNIGYFVFNNCPALTSIVVEIGNPYYDSRNNCNAIIATGSNTLLYGCQNTIIPDTITCIEDWAFRGCSTLQAITIPDSVTHIGQYAFVDCSALKYADLPSSITVISDSLFSNCSSLVSITIPHSVTTIEPYAFCGCTSLTAIDIPNTVMKIGEAAFARTTALQSIVVAAGNSRYDSRNNCNAIIIKSSNTLLVGCQNTVIPENVNYIASYAFWGCSKLTDITIPASVTGIYSDAFIGCTALTTITLPNNLSEIGSAIFDSCPSLQVIRVPKGKKERYCQPYLGSNGLGNYDALVVEY